MATVIVYYSGHGVKDPTDKDVWLQLAGQTRVSDHLGISIGGLIETARGASYLGELHVIVDACFSGQGALTGSLTLKEFGKQTTVFTSSSDIQNSYPIQVDPTHKLSAFTHTLLRAWGPEWGTADDNGDGILQFPELATFSILALKKYFLQKAIDAEMRPQLMGTHHEEIFFGYRREHVTRWHSTTREALNLLALERSLITRVTVTPGKDPVTPAIPQEAQTLAKQVSPAPDDFYALGLKAQAEGRMEEADTFFQQAEAQEEPHKDKLAKIYLARGRNHTYQGQYQAALPWYQKTLALKPTKDPERLNEFGTAFYLAGRYDEALPILHEALTLREKTLKGNDPDLATSFNNLATLYKTQGKYAEAELYYQRALRINELALGPDHPQVALSLNYLAQLYYTQGKYAEAVPLYQRNITILETALGVNHPNVATSLNNLAELHRTQGQYAAADPLYQRALAIDEAVLGPTHSDVERDLNNLAELHRAQEQYAQAEPLYQRALRINEQVLGADHPQVALNLNNLAGVYGAQGKYAEAESLYQRALRITERALGPNNPHVARNLNNLAELHRTLGQYDEAEFLYKRALAINETALGPDHPGVAINLNNLALLYKTQGKYDEAEPLFQRVISIFETALGMDHPNVATSLNNLAELYRTQEKYAEAEPLYQRSFWIFVRGLGPEHPYVQQSFGNYLAFLEASGQPHSEEDALSKLTEALQSINTQSPSSSP